MAQNEYAFMEWEQRINDGIQVIVLRYKGRVEIAQCDLTDPVSVLAAMREVVKAMEYKVINDWREYGDA